LRDHESIFMVLMAVLVMGLAVYAAGPGARLLVGSALAGLGISVVAIRWKRT